MTPVIDLMFKLLIIIAVTQLVNWPVFTIFLFNFAVLFYIWFMFYFSPYDEKFNRLQLEFNAASYLVFNYHLFLFTKYVDAEMLPHVANSVIYLFWICVAVNVLLTVPVQLFKVFVGFK